jgi:sugar phosphate isomerase/epimerase/FMN phosphatase YigB (HAD superfamily)
MGNSRNREDVGMTQPPIEAIIFDVGGTLRITQKRAASEKPAYIQKICDLIGSDLPAGQLLTQLEQRAKAYKGWSIRMKSGLNEVDFWTRWMLPDWPPEQIRPLAIQLNQIWREAQGVRKVLPEVRPLILELFRRGYHLGIASNTTTSTEVPQMLKDLGLAGYFESTVLSCTVKSRKPEPTLLLTAAGQMGIIPDRCAYVGNRADLDVPSARRASFQQVILIHDPILPPDDLSGADATISNLNELLELFPAPQVHRGGFAHFAYPPAINAALSSMWGIKNFERLDDFFEAALRLGFAKIELNHQVSQKMLDGIDLPVGRFSSVHEPCPAEVPTRILTERDWLISATDEEKRAQGVNCVKRSIDLAQRLKAEVVVVHSGNVIGDHSQENRLRNLLAAGQKSTPEYDLVREEMLGTRQKLCMARFEAVKRSLRELLAYAGSRGVRLGLENRYHWMDFPGLDEMEELLDLAGPDRLGFILDTGHASALDKLGFFPQWQWLDRFGSRLIGIHLHDTIGVTDHLAPGLGDIDFDAIRPYLPENAFRTLELGTQNTFSQVKTGFNYLAKKGYFHSL